MWDYFSFTCFFYFNLGAQTIEIEQIKQVAINAFSERTGSDTKQLKIYQIIPLGVSDEILIYVLNFQPDGYIVISNEEAAEPILGYGIGSVFSPGQVPPGLQSLLDGYKNEILSIRKSGIKPTIELAEKWIRYSSKDFARNRLKSYTPGNVLLETSWGQDGGYKQKCPEYPNTNQHCLVGCGGVALGQILYYWGCRVFPDDTISYLPENFQDSVKVWFYNQRYNWAAMSRNSSDTVNARLLFHSAASVSSNFGLNYTSSIIYAAVWAFRNYWGFNCSNADEKNDYNQNPNDWILLLKESLDEGYPVYYTAEKDNDSIAHAWVVDGYNSNNEFHCNWGWAGSYNGWFTLGSLNTLNGNYNTDQRAIFEIYPLLDGCLGMGGSNVICYESNQTYTVTIPTTASLQWVKSSKLTQVGGNTGTSYTVYANIEESDTANIRVYIKNSKGQLFMTRTRNVWVGPPAFSISGSDLLAPFEEGMAVVEYNSHDMGIDPYSFNWSYTGPLSDISGSYINADYTASDETGQGYIYFSIENSCGETENRMYFQVVDQYLMVISPNPASDFIEVTFDKIEKDSDLTPFIKVDKKASINGIENFRVELWGEKSGLIFSESFENGKARISCENLQKGIYYLHVIIEGKTYKQKVSINPK